MTRSARSTWNYAAALAFSALSMVLALVTTPILLKSLGQARLGAARAVMDWTGYLSLLELGLGGALSPLLAQALAQRDPVKVGEMMSAGFRAYAKVAIGMLAGGWVLVGMIVHLIKIDPAYVHDLRMATFVGAAGVLLMAFSPLRALVEANQRGYLVNLLLMLQSATIALCAVVFAIWDWGITGQMLAVVIGGCLFVVLMVIDALMHYRSLLPNARVVATPKARRALWSLNTPTFIMSVCGRVSFLTDNIIIGSAISAGAIVPFLLTQRLAQLAQSQLQSIGSATWAGLAELYARGEHQLFRQRFLELTRLVTMLGLAVLVPILSYDRAFVRLWVGEAQFAGAALISLASFNALIMALMSLWGWAFGGTGQTARMVPLGIASASVNLLISLGFTGWFAHSNPHRALLGPLLGTTCAGVLVSMPGLPLLLRETFGIPLSDLAVAVGSPILPAIPFAAVLMWIANAHAPANWFSLAVHMGVACSVFVLICWATQLTRADRAAWKHRFRLAVGTGAAL